MKFAVVVLTYEAERLGRAALLRRTLDSAGVAFPKADLMLFNNGGPMVFPILLGRTLTCGCQHPSYKVRTPGAGRNAIMRMLEAQDIEPEIVVCSDDDMLWMPGACKKLGSFWSEAPADVVIACGLLEPDYEWNTPRYLLEVGGVRALVRDSAPAAAWSFRWRDRGLIFPLSEEPGSEDTDACLKLRQQGYHIVQLDLCTHEGVDVSTHNNRPMGRPLDRAKWGI